MTWDAVVIGAGPNGLVAGAILAKHGRKTLIVERAPEIGGHTRAIEFAPGYRAPLNEDCGWLPPSVAMSVGLGDSLRMTTPPQSMAYLGGDGRLRSLPSDVGSAANAIRELSPKDAAAWPGFVERLHRFASLLGELYQLVPPDIDTKSLGEVLPLVGVARKLRKLGRADMTEFLRVMPMSIQDLLDDTFETDALKAAVASGAVRDLRQGPRSGGTTFNLLHYLVGASRGSVRARPFWTDGPGAFTKAVAAVATGAGAMIRTGTPAQRINVRDHAVTGVTLANGEEVAAKTVISTADPRRTFLGLMDPVWLDPEFLLAVRNVKMRGCTAVVLMATGGKVGTNTQQGFTSTVSLTAGTADLERAADAAKYGELPARPHVEFFVPSQRWSSLAPDGKQVVVARVQYASYALKDGWNAERVEQVGRAAVDAIERVIPGFGGRVEQRVVLTPREIEERFGVTEGALTHGELTLDQILFMRPVPGWGHYATPVSGLFLGGAGAHPGPGVLGGAGYLAARRALR
jgi:phytoene dehydrogenase-like protein